MMFCIRLARYNMCPDKFGNIRPSSPKWVRLQAEGKDEMVTLGRAAAKRRCHKLAKQLAAGADGASSCFARGREKG